MTPKRTAMNMDDYWKLNKLFLSDELWQQALSSIASKTERFCSHKGAFTVNPQKLKSLLMLWVELDSLVERVVHYAYLRLQEDLTNEQKRSFYALAVKAQKQYTVSCSFLHPELLAMPPETAEAFLADPDLADFFEFLSTIFRKRHHTLGEKEEALLLGISPLGQIPHEAYSALVTADLQCETIEGNLLPLASYRQFLRSSEDSTRLFVYQNLLKLYDAHKHSIMVLHAHSANYLFFMAQARSFRDARDAALFDDFVPSVVYDTLLTTINTIGIPFFQRYQSLRCDRLNKHPLTPADVYAPLVPVVKTFYPFEQAVDLLCAASCPLGDDYVQVLRQGLLGGWVDRYANYGKCSSEFSLASYYGGPNILLNYDENNLHSLFTLAREAGRSMLAYYSAKNNPYQHYRATTLTAEVASAFSETLLFESLLHQASDDAALQNYLLDLRTNNIAALLFEQTLLADLEWQTHHSTVFGKAPSLESLRHSYKLLLTRYFGDYLAFTDLDTLACLYEPHLYQSFYAYKYAAGLTASLVLSRDILADNKTAISNYKEFLKKGGNQPPLDSLKMAGADLMQKQVFIQALNEFDRLRTLLQDNLSKKG